MIKPLVTVITPSFNSESFIVDAIESVRSQNYENVEHIVCDGGSTDRTLEMLSRYSHLKIISEPDKGLYDANNKGFSLAEGEIVTILNSDDVLEDGAISAAIAAFQSDDSIEMVSGTTRMFENMGDGSTKEDKPEIPMLLQSKDNEERDKIFCRLLKAAPYINSRFFKKTLIERIGDFSLGYPISSDREFMLRVVLAGVRDHELGMLSYAYRRHPGSLTMDTEKSNRGPIAIEHMNMALDFMRQVNSPDMIKCLRHWHTREAYKLIRVYLAKIKIGYAFSVLVTALKIDPWWFLRAAALRPYKTYMKLVKIIR